MSFILRVIHDLFDTGPAYFICTLPDRPVRFSIVLHFAGAMKKSNTLEKVAFANISLASVSTVVTGAMGIAIILFCTAASPPTTWLRSSLQSVLCWCSPVSRRSCTGATRTFSTAAESPLHHSIFRLLSDRIRARILSSAVIIYRFLISSR